MILRFQHSSPLTGGRRAIMFGAIMLLATVCADEPSSTRLRRQCFDDDPAWDALNHRVVPDSVPEVTQDFGFSETRFAGRSTGEAGGTITRCARPTYYADAIPETTLDHRLTASGSFALTSSASSSGAFFGWFNSDQPGGGGRPVSSFGLEFDGEESGARLAVRMLSHTNRTTGTFITPFTPGGYRPTPIRNDGTRYHWTLQFDPHANEERGRIEFRIAGESDRPEEFEGRLFTVDLPAGFRQHGATFDRFGLLNLMKPGQAMTIYFDDLEYNGRSADFTVAPDWVGSANRTTFRDTAIGAHNFGFSRLTNVAGGQTYNWSLKYDPGADNAQGEIRVVLGDDSVALPVSERLRQQGAVFTHFGLFTSTNGGQMLRLYLDDLRYSVSTSDDEASQADGSTTDSFDNGPK